MRSRERESRNVSGNAFNLRIRLESCEPTDTATHISRHFLTPPRVLLGLFALLKLCIAAAITVADSSSLERGGSEDFSYRDRAVA